VERKGTTRNSADPKLRKKRYLKNLLLQKKRPPRKKEGMCTWLLQAHMHIMSHGWLTPHRQWFCEYEIYEGGNVFLGNDSTTRFIGREKFKLRLIDGSIITLPSVLHIPGLA
jgi:hypothetical protein